MTSNPGRPIITLTTDFGTRDTFVAQMKGVILSICPAARVVDLSHGVPPQDVAAGSFLLETGIGAFPPGTIHVVVVDPGVGTGRRPLAVRNDRHVFVAPDNGVLSRVLDEEPATEAHVIAEAHFVGPQVSFTFHGRDVFAPAAAWIARGTALRNLGPAAGELVRLPRADAELVPGASAEVPVLHVDRFGNVVLDVRESMLRSHLEAGRTVAVSAGSTDVDRLCRTYAEAPAGEPVLIVGSAGYLEISIDRGRAADRLGLGPGSRVAIRLS